MKQNVWGAFELFYGKRNRNDKRSTLEGTNLKKTGENGKDEEEKTVRKKNKKKYNGRSVSFWFLVQ